MKTKKSERGQSLVELAISIVIILYLLSGVVEFGMAFFQFIQLRDAAQEGALYASINPTDSAGIESRVRNSSTSPVDLTVINGPKAVNVIIEYPSQICEGNGVKVRVEFNHKIFMPFIATFIGSNTIALKASVTDTILTPVCP